MAAGAQDPGDFAGEIVGVIERVREHDIDARVRERQVVEVAPRDPRIVRARVEVDPDGKGAEVAKRTDFAAEAGRQAEYARPALHELRAIEPPTEGGRIALLMVVRATGLPDD